MTTSRKCKKPVAVNSKQTHIKSWKPFKNAVEEIFGGGITWEETELNPPTVPLHLKSETLPIEFTRGYELFGRGAVVHEKRSEQYRQRVLRWVQICPDPFYIVVVSKCRDTFRYDDIKQKKGKHPNHMTVVCVHLKGYVFLKTTKKQLKALRGKLQEIKHAFPPLITNQPARTIIEG
ncbi:MAG: hypothetical protein WCO12_01390 [bacterium]